MRIFYLLSFFVCVFGGCSALPSTGTPSGGDTESTAMQGMTAAHNKIREGATPSPSPSLSPLKWSSKLAQDAQAWADKCKWGHSQTAGVGENIFAGTGDYKPEQVVNSWAKESADYNYDSNSCASGKVCGHYTQIVWGSTQEVGCGMASCKGLLGGDAVAQFWVCQYSPPGNYVGKKPY